jgi:hypothetical protein
MDLTKVPPGKNSSSFCQHALHTFSQLLQNAGVKCSKVDSMRLLSGRPVRP